MELAQITSFAIKKGASGSEMREYSSWGVRNLHNKLPLHLQKQIVCYLDDLLIHSPILEQHLKILSELFSIASGVILNTPKCELIKTTCILVPPNYHNMIAGHKLEGGYFPISQDH